MISSHSTLRLGIMLIASILPFPSLRAGDDGTSAHPRNLSVSALVDGYLQDQKIVHFIDTKGGGFKGEGAETLTVKIYDVSTDAQQSAICAALAATAKKGRVRETTVLFFKHTQASAGQAAGYRPSQLPSGNGEVEFPRDSQPASYYLLRTVKL